MKAAHFKRKHLLEKYPLTKVDIVTVLSPDDFNSVWKDIHIKTTEKTKGEIPVYELYEVHFLGHGAPDQLYLKGVSYTVDMVKKLKVLPWHKEYGILVLHACRTGRMQEYEKGEYDENAKCIAAEFSKIQKTRVIGQMVHATFCVEHSNTIQTGIKLVRDQEGHTVWLPTYRTFKDKVGFKYRDCSFANFDDIDIVSEDNVVLWGYKAGSNVDKLYSTDKEYGRLSDLQVWPCRLFVNGVSQDEQRIVEADKFNANDLEYM
ncbi:TPA: hypothetical protein N3A31_004588 [Salmonella enterica subsp. houtenae serovar 43:z4,z32:-]|uniref:Uncharacterized protein n=1 Tax=Salmonella enterica TaxID=28901 RepID=A0A612U9C1_SALER|nr:hypothetical protein [Salmonella enterica]EDT6512488.1 hypothetical protein [Salmonella enterica subsp. enterica serovar Tallahassee]HCM1866523.1 hypothetical protein [Salmonella enterica subsp. houtenae serovar 43:z4,z32:-]EIG0993188.1 hypothetical protein [Salmonella enterica]EJP2999814.1 hypothetical protein [Salmonella enterica]